VFKLIIFIVLQGYCLFSSNAMAATCTTDERGINLAGAEFAPGQIPGVQGRHYRFPSAEHIRYYDEAGFNSIRLPFIWERLQPKLFEALDSAYLAQLINFMDEAAQTGQRVVLDLHNQGRYRGNIVGSDAVPAAAFRDLWRRIASTVHQHKALLAYGLMNEPHDTGGLWHKVAQAGVDGVRDVDPVHEIFVAGESWSSAERWPRVNPAPFVSDPSELVVYEAHAYFDPDASGRYLKPLGDVNLPQLVEQRLRPFVDWLTRYGQRGVIGEWGVPGDDPRWLGALDKFMDIADQSCLGWFYWAGGIWGSTYTLSLEPIDGRDRPQMERIRPRLKRKN
jgi:endoglucanase